MYIIGCSQKQTKFQTKNEIKINARNARYTFLKPAKYFKTRLGIKFKNANRHKVLVLNIYTLYSGILLINYALLEEFLQF